MANKTEDLYKKKLNYNNEYNRMNYRSFSIRYNVNSEKDLICWLESVPSLKVYLTGLIRKDMEKQARSTARAEAKKNAEKVEEPVKKKAAKKTAAKRKKS